MKPKILLNNRELLAEASNVGESTSQGFDAEEIHVETKNPLIITAAEIVKLLNISHGTFTKWLKEGRFASVRMMPRQKGENYKFCKADFERWLNTAFRT